MHPNIASSKLLEKTGFYKEAKLKNAALRKDKWMDELIYSKFNGKFKLR